MPEDRRKIDAETILNAFNEHAQDDVMTAKDIKAEIAKVKDIHDSDQETRREFESTVNHVLFGSKKLGESGMKAKVDEMHSRQGVQITQMAEVLRILNGDKLTGEPGLIENMKPVLEAWKSVKWLIGGFLALAAVLGSLTIISSFIKSHTK